ncbi:hypothetical protein MNBD_GAMMA04-1977, partial [hydrothermal vent metagenome]
GPHGSDNSFILKGNWDTKEESHSFASQLCFRCHAIQSYSNLYTSETKKSGFSGLDNLFPGTNLHVIHDHLISGVGLRCTWCHVAIPHGWRNKALLANVNGDPEAVSCGGNVPCGTDTDSAGPYFQKAYLGGNTGGVTWKASGDWRSQNCNSWTAVQTPGNGCTGWMSTTCLSPS